jgi:hypothetical protein
MKKYIFLSLCIFLLPLVASAQQAAEPDKATPASFIESTTIGGYGEAHFDYNSASETSTMLLRRFVLFFEHSFSEKLVFKSEFEFENAAAVAGDVEDTFGEIDIEQAYLDYRASETFGIRAGILVLPIGYTNEIHEPPTFNGVQRPYVEQFLVPSTLHEIGVGIFGKVAVLDGLSYKLYLTSGLNSKGFGGPTAFREGSSEGHVANANSLMLTGRAEYVTGGLKLGGSFLYSGTAAKQDSLGIGPFSIPLLMYAVDAHYNFKNLSLKGFLVGASLPDAGKINSFYGSDIGKTMGGGYLEAAYDVMPFVSSTASGQLTPFVRYENFDLNSTVASPLVKNEAYNQSYLVAGITYKPLTSVAVKFDYTSYRNKAQTNQTNYINLGIGYSF